MRSSAYAVAIFALTAALGLSACGKKDESPGELIEDNMTIEVPVEDANALNSVEVAAPANVAVNVTNAAAPLPEFTDTEQMRDDADATGLTSRLPTDDVSGAAANETQPAQ